MDCCVREEENSLGFYVAKSEENLIEGVYPVERVNAEDTLKEKVTPKSVFFFFHRQ